MGLREGLEGKKIIIECCSVLKIVMLIIGNHKKNDKNSVHCYLLIIMSVN